MTTTFRPREVRKRRESQGRRKKRALFAAHGDTSSKTACIINAEVTKREPTDREGEAAILTFTLINVPGSVAWSSV
jgi:hypothetical protein